MGRNYAVPLLRLPEGGEELSSAPAEASLEGETKPEPKKYLWMTRKVSNRRGTAGRGYSVLSPAALPSAPLFFQILRHLSDINLGLLREVSAPVTFNIAHPPIVCGERCRQIALIAIQENS